MWISRLGVTPILILEGKNLWTLLTSMFMHADIMHLLGNMIYLWVFGDNVEDTLGHLKYLLFYLFGGFVASFTHIASVIVTLPTVGRVGLMIPSVGASGAISAVLGAYMLLYPRARIRTVVIYYFIQIISVPAYYYLGFWFLYQLLMGMISLTGLYSGVAFWAHIGGFAAGYLTIGASGIRAKPKKPTPRMVKPIRPIIVSPYVKTPLVDVILEGDRIRILAELPGVSLEDIRIAVTSWDVTISAERGDIRFYRHIILPAPAVPQIEDLTYHNGVLSFTLRRLYAF